MQKQLKALTHDGDFIDYLDVLNIFRIFATKYNIRVIMNKSDIFWQSYLNLEKEAIEVSKYIFITDVITVCENGVEKEQPYKSQLETFSPHIADLLVRCCVQIEAISKELYFNHGGTKKRGDNSIRFDMDCLKLIDKLWETHNKKVLIVAPLFHLIDEKNKVLNPLREAHKWQGTYWERCYQAVKHDRVSSLSKGNVKAFLHALAALYLLNLYYRNDSWVLKYEDISKRDYSLGSSLFAVKPPIAGQLWYGNQPLYSESPYVVAYVDDVFKHIEDAQRAEKDALVSYWTRQPELQEPAFIAQLNAVFEKQKRDPSYRVIPLWELTKYRLNKIIPKTLPFEERKKRLINSEAWKGRINQRNKHLAPNDITEENIQGEIDSSAIHWGMEIEWSFKKEEWELFATSSAGCRIYIPEKNIENKY